VVAREQFAITPAKLRPHNPLPKKPQYQSIAPSTLTTSLHPFRQSSSALIHITRHLAFQLLLDAQSLINLALSFPTASFEKGA